MAAVDQGRDEVSGVLERLRIALVRDATLDVDVRPRHHVPGIDDLTDGAGVTADDGYSLATASGEAGPGGELEAVVTDGARIVAASARRARFVSSTIIRTSSARSCEAASRPMMRRTVSSDSASSASTGCTLGPAGDRR